jgi:hypothetical protein
MPFPELANESRINCINHISVLIESRAQLSDMAQNCIKRSVLPIICDGVPATICELVTS